MNYFRCTVGGSGGKWKLTVTCTSDFAGLTITCTNGTTTLTKTCPSSSPYTVVFNIPNGGTWTISGTASGQTGTTTVIIPDSATLTPPIPTGSTVTPVNDIQIWLHCANIWDKTYTTINQVLSDTSTLLALISSNNAADYMARSTNWTSSVCANQTAMGYIGNNNYCANKLLANSTWRTSICNSTYFESVLNVKVPTMTSNTAPSGEAITSGAYSTTPAYYAFDGNDSTMYQSIDYSLNHWVGYAFPSAVKIYKIVGITQNSDGNPQTLAGNVQASSNSAFSTPIALGTWSFANVPWSEERTISCIVSGTINAYRYYRLYRTSGADRFRVRNANFYGRKDV